MSKLTRRQRIALAVAPIGPAASLMLYHFRPFGGGDWQDFVFGLPIGICVGAAFGLLLWKRRAC
jgi:hypothetical protein